MIFLEAMAGCTEAGPLDIGPFLRAPDKRFS